MGNSILIDSLTARGKLVAVGRYLVLMGSDAIGEMVYSYDTESGATHKTRPLCDPRFPSIIDDELYLSGYSLCRVPVRGPLRDATILVDAMENGPEALALAVTDEALYWTSVRNDLGGDDYSVYAAALDGSGRTLLFSNEDPLIGLSVAGARLFLLCVGCGTDQNALALMMVDLVTGDTQAVAELPPVGIRGADLFQVGDTIIVYGPGIYAYQVSTGNLSSLKVSNSPGAMVGSDESLFMISQHDDLLRYPREAWNSVGPVELLAFDDNDGGGEISVSALDLRGDDLFYWEEGLTVVTVPEAPIYLQQLAAILASMGLMAVRKRNQG